MAELVLVEQRDGRALVTLTNPATRNALSRELLLQLADRLEELRAADDCHSVVLTGAAATFCSGGDVSGMVAERTLPMGRERMIVAHRVVHLIAQMGKPVIAAVEGFAAGAGFSLAMAADYVVAASNAKFVSSFAKVNLLPDLGLMWTLPQRVGLARAKHIMMSARVVLAEEALELGMADRLVAPGATLAAAYETAAELSAHAPIATALLKAAYARGIHGLDDALAYEMDNQAALYLTADHREAVNAFMQKRAPNFLGV